MPPPNQTAPPAPTTVTEGTATADTQTHPFPQRELPADAGSQNAPPPEVGTVVGPFVLKEKLGEGVSCHVFRGWDQARSAPVALKILNWANVYDRTAAMKQLRMEAATLARVKHPKVVRFIDFGFDPRWPYLVTEFFEGRPLGELLRAGGALPPEWCLFLVSQMSDALDLVNVRLGAEVGSVSYELYATNLFDQNKSIDPYQGWANANRTRPRVVGVKVGYAF